MRTGTANTPPMHQTTLSYETAAPDGGRLAPKTPKYAKPPFPAAQELTDDTSDSSGGIRKRTRTKG